MKRKSPVMAVALAGLFMYTSCSPTEQAETKDYTQYVNTFIGAADNGHTFPGACYPYNHKGNRRLDDSLNALLGRGTSMDPEQCQRICPFQVLFPQYPDLDYT